MPKNITRKEFIISAGVVSATTLAGLSACQPAPDERKEENITDYKRYTWNMVTTWPPNFPIIGEGCNLFARWIDEMSGGQLKIKVYGGGELIPALEVFDAVSSGTAEIGSATAYYWAGKSAAAQFFAAVPFGMNAQQMHSWLYAGGGMALWEEVYAPFNLLPLVGGSTGVQMAGWFNKEIKTMNDLKGLKMRIPGLGGKVLDHVGGTAVLSAGAEIYTNLERGVIDATEWVGPFHDYLMGFHEIARYYYYPGWHEPGTILELMVNKLKFERLPAHLQEIIRAAAARLDIWTLSEFEVKNAEYLEKIRAEGKVEIRHLPSDVLSHLRSASHTILQDLASSDPLCGRIYAAIEAFRASMQGWADVSESQFYRELSFR